MIMVNVIPVAFASPKFVQLFIASIVKLSAGTTEIFQNNIIHRGRMVGYICLHRNQLSTVLHESGCLSETE